MKTAIATLRSLSPYSQSKPHQAPKLDNETADDYDKRTWREHLYVNDKGFVIIPPPVWKNALTDSAQFLSMKIPGKGGAKYTKHFVSGVSVVEPLVLSVKKDAAKSECLYMNADGRRGGSKRVWRTYPVVHEWGGDVEYLVLDDEITEAVFRAHVVACGRLVGIGRFRPRNNGYYGRFELVKLKWE